MAEKKKPQEDLVALAGRAMTNPGALSPTDIKRMAARILDDQRNDPEPNDSKPSLASKVVAKVSEYLPSAVTGEEKPGKTRPKGAVAEKPAPETNASPKPAPAKDAPPKPASKPKAPAKAAEEPAPKPAKAPAAKPKPAAKAKAAPKG